MGVVEQPITHNIRINPRERNGEQLMVELDNSKVEDGSAYILRIREPYCLRNAH